MPLPQRTGNTPLASPLLPAGIGRRLKRGGKQQKRRLPKSTSRHDCRDHHNSIGDGYAESVHNSGHRQLVAALDSDEYSPLSNKPLWITAALLAVFVYGAELTSFSVH